MKYFSTRDPSLLVTFEQAVMQGLAADGGLYIPHTIPHLPPYFLSRWQDLTFQQLCLEIFPLFIGADIPRNDLDVLVANAFKTFRHAEVTPVRKISNHLYLLELFHGPTFAFKDVALQFLGQLFDYFLRKDSNKNQKMTILCATSGDTGGAAIESVRSKPSLSIYIMHPLNRISPIQKAQMTSVLDKNVHNIAINGTFDDCQMIVKQVFSDHKWKSDNKILLGAVNSINWARILAQIIYYIYAYFALRKQSGAGDQFKVRFSVPTGNFGDILAGFYAKKLGLPIETLIIATNQNDILHRFFSEGVYEKRDVEQTISPAMDIQVSSNFERWLWHFMFDMVSGSHPELEDEKVRQYSSECVKNWLKSLHATGRFSCADPLPVSVTLKNPLLADARSYFLSHRVSDGEILGAIKKYSVGDLGVILDPHTAIGVVAAEHHPSTDAYTLCLATAHPVKFVGAVVHALEGKTVYENYHDSEHDIEKKVLSGKQEVPGMVLPVEFVGLMEKKQKFEILDNSKDVVEKFILETISKEREQ